MGPSEAFAKDQEEQERQAELEQARAELAEIHEQAQRGALDRAPPATVRALRTFMAGIRRAGHQCDGGSYTKMLSAASIRRIIPAWPFAFMIAWCAARLTTA